jgi:DNA-binding LacI/PurR family transcriptional regulator
METFPCKIKSKRVTKEYLLAVTIRDVAKRAGVGIGTVSSVLNNSRPVNETTRRKVLEAVKDLDFVPNPSGRRLSMGKTYTIAVIVPFFTRPSQAERLRGVMSVITGSDYEISLFTVETISQRNKILQTVPRQGRIDGLLIFSLDPSEKDLLRIKQEKIPTVLVEARHADFPSIYFDDTRGARIAVQHLLNLGHRKIAYVGETLDNAFGFKFSEHRYQGYKQALEAAGLTPNPNYRREGLSTREDGRQLAADLLQQADKPTAIFTYSDEMALGVLEAARELNLSVPQNLSVVGYDDISIAHFAQLTTVRQQLHEAGREAINLLLNILEYPKHPAVHVRMPAELIVRQTTGPPLT